ncbi:GNAT family N-acetyltransferase [Arthrobacter oryzae]|uniref:RimJ/RimL family protein N-acetyltransferase n=1 Tax=Arthrobacter oryzae TaxID=409290 RepID=A0A495FLU2_9MICC|nr:GNAT family N-acetyltransferase [Arthrobacter oryzae]RKR30203.1 RimJ/RimL family protein N-acetyltransferase [Arthrobacter oryzae]
MQLRTERLLLREYTANDFDAVHAFASDQRIAKFVEWGPNTTADTKTFLETCLVAQSDPNRANFTLAVTVPPGDPIGSVGLSLTGGRGDLGYVIAPGLWGRGYATEAAESLLRFGMEELGLSEITATCRPGNVASARVLEKIGMSRNGLRKADKLIRGQWQDSLVFSVSA